MRPGASSPVAGARTAVVADADELYASAVARLLQKNCGFHEVYEVATMEAGIRRIEEDGHVALMVLGIDAGSGPVDVSGVGELRRRFPFLVVAAISASDERSDILAALSAGVHGYVVRSMPLARIGAALVSVSNGEIYLPRTVADLAPKSLASTGDESVARSTDVAARLTARQRDVLRLVQAGHSNKEIASELRLTEGTVKVHVNAIFRALGLGSRSEARAIEFD